jgi:hypothetical protein
MLWTLLVQLSSAILSVTDNDGCYYDDGYNQTDYGDSCGGDFGSFVGLLHGYLDDELLDVMIVVR